MPRWQSAPVRRISATFLAASRRSTPADFFPHQWRKWRIPVNTMAMPCSLASATFLAASLVMNY
jgi:hypothetical protein